MPTVRAVVVDPNATAHLTLADVESAMPGPSEAVIRVAAISLNRGEVRGAQTSAPGSRPGWDIAGVVEAPAADGSGPPAGARVVGVLRSGAWAELVPVPARSLAVLPEAVSFEQAATLPVAGLTALYALEQGGFLLDKRVLVTGASGGVGNLAVQMARDAGAHVVGLVRQERHAASVREAGAEQVVADDTGAGAAAFGPYDLILESVGGAVLATALTMLATRGKCVSYGVSAGAEVTFNAGAFFRAGGATFRSLSVFAEIEREGAGVGLARLARLVAAGKLRPEIAVQAPWTEIGPVAQQLLDRAYPGKAVLHVAKV